MLPARSLLYVPGNRPDLIDKIERFEADGYILDLEDGVPHEAKESARRCVTEAAPRLLKAGVPLHVRVNALHTPWHREDLQAAISAGITRVHLPKVAGPDDVRDADRRLLDLGVRWGIKPDEIELYPTVETSRAVLEADAIAAASARVAGLLLGADDLTAEWGTTRSRDGLELSYVRSRLVVSAAAYGLPAIDATWPFHDDLAGCAAEARLARQLGFKGKQAIHPAQCPIINAAFTPDPADVARAREVVAAAETARAAGRGTSAAAGTQIDAAVERSARRLIEWSERLTARRS